MQLMLPFGHALKGVIEVKSFPIGGFLDRALTQTSGNFQLGVCLLESLMIFRDPGVEFEDPLVIFEILMDKRLPASTFRVLLFLLSQETHYIVTPSALAQDYGITKTAAKYALRKIHELGYSSIVTDERGCFLDRVIRPFSRQHPGFKTLVRPLK